MENRNNIESSWQRLINEAEAFAKEEQILGSFLYETILSHSSLQEALSFHLANKLSSNTLRGMKVREIAQECYASNPDIVLACVCDLNAILERDAAVDSLIVPFLYFKGFHAIQAYRISHWLWQKDRKVLALHFQGIISELFGLDIHPAAKIGCGLMVDHGTSVVIGETAVVDDDVSMLHEVTLGGTGKSHGDRHPKVRKGVLIGAGAKILGNIEIGEGAKVGAGSVVLNDVPPHSTVVGVPAKVVGDPSCQFPSREMNHMLPEYEI
ncbi:serine O-acetyltransferase [Labilibacter marinus]|uniref:serine O-acetyltransferase n=1 Tax=Labilibacter marinus TaxID=1477105 RepID=UPI00083780F8|nr:serine O-acetyltransferase [Labilibacter marinus]